MRKRTGTIVKTKDGRWQAMITLPDGSRKRLDPMPKGKSEAWYREKAAAASEKAIAENWTRTVPESELDPESGATWWKDYFAHRESKGLTPVAGVYTTHIAPVLGDKHPRDWTVEDCEAMRDALDVKIAAGQWTREKRVYRFGWKRAWNVWALFTSACKASCRSKNKALRVRRDNPCGGVEPPDRGASKQKQWLYPDEFSKLVSDKALPLRWLRFYALLTYTYLRPNELAALLWQDVDVDTGIIHVSKAWNFDKGEPKPYPKSAAGVRFVPIEAELVPLLVSLKEGAEETDRVLPNLPPPEDWAATFRAHLTRAGISRAALFEDSETVKQITLYDLRASGITWRTLRSDDARLIQRAAGHERYSTTEGYVREAEIFKGRVGAPFPPLPPSLIASGVNRTPQSFTPPSRSDHSPPECRQISGESGASGSVPKGNRTVVNIEEFRAIPLAIVA